MSNIIDINTTLAALKDQYSSDISLYNNAFSDVVVSEELTVIINNIEYTAEILYNSISNSTAVQLDLDGEIFITNNSAQFSDTKNNIKTLNGSLNKVGSSFLLADCINKNAKISNNIKMSLKNVVIENYFIVNTYNSKDELFFNYVLRGMTKEISASSTIWQYKSPNYITSFELDKNSIIEVNIRDDGIDNDEVTIRQDSTIKFINSTSKPIQILSGKTNYEQFYSNVNSSSFSLSFFGDNFQSGILQPEEEYEYKFVEVDDIDFITYPDLLLGKIQITNEKVNGNDVFIISENDGSNMPFSNKILKVDSYGDIVNSYGESYIVSPRHVKSLDNGNILVSC